MNLHSRLARLALCCSLSLPLATLAQMPMSSAPGDPAQIYGKLMSGMQSEIISAAEAMPADKYNFAPTQGEFTGVRTFGQQVKHLAESNYEFFDGWNIGPAPQEADIEKLTSKDDIVKALKDSYVYAHKAIDTITAANAFESLGKDKGTRAGTAAFCIAHAMDHYGQIVVYLRLNGIVPPASRKSGN